MKKFSLIYFILVFGLVAACKGEDSENSNTTSINIATEDSIAHSPKIELVFCLDATGSMSGLIQTAKDKIWDIVSELAESESEPEIMLGMIFYRDRGDKFVSKMYQLTQDMDSLYTELLKIEAAGGGDTPESVNLALYEAVEKIDWSEDKDAFRTIFLVGDCPPHMDYDQEVEYPETCKIATQKNIVINTLKLGNSCSEAIQHFRSIAMKTNGHFEQIDQNAEDIVIQTPYDDSINLYSYDVDQSKLYYGGDGLKTYNNLRKEKANALYSTADAAANSSRAKFNMSKSGKQNWFGENELIEDLSQGKVSWDTIAIQNLPDELQDMSKDERKAEVNKLLNERKHNLERLKVLTEKRKKYIGEKMENSNTPTFSGKILKIMMSQAEKQGVNL